MKLLFLFFSFIISALYAQQLNLTDSVIFKITYPYGSFNMIAKKGDTLLIGKVGGITYVYDLLTRKTDTLAFQFALEYEDSLHPGDRQYTFCKYLPDHYLMNRIPVGSYIAGNGSGRVIRFYDYKGNLRLCTLPAGPGFGFGPERQAVMDCYWAIDAEPIMVTSKYFICSLKHSGHVNLNRDDTTLAGSKRLGLCQYLDPEFKNPKLPLFSVHNYKIPPEGTDMLKFTKEEFIRGCSTRHYIGELGDVYQSNMKKGLFTPSYCQNHVFAFDSTHELIYFNAPAEPDIRVYSVKGNLVKRFTSTKDIAPERHVPIRLWTQKEVDSVLSAKTYKAFREARNRLDAYSYGLSTNYSSMYVSPAQHRLYRNYYPPLPQQTMDSLYYQTKMPASEIHDRNIWSKSTYLQCFDTRSGKLLFDIPAPPFFKVIDVTKDGYIWAIYNIRPDENKLRIGKFQLK
jgi:hypothetical protein